MTTTITMTIQTPDYPVGPFASVSRRGGTLAFLGFGVFLGFARMTAAVCVTFEFSRDVAAGGRDVDGSDGYERMQ